MLMIKTHLAPDAFGGTGLFSSEYIRKGTLIWRYDASCDQFYTIEKYLGLSEEEQKIVSHYGYRGRMNSTDGVFLSHDNDKYTNHSETPNTRYYYRPPAHGSKLIDSRYHVAIAEEGIREDTEITMDYNDINLPGVPPELYQNIGTCFDFLDPLKNMNVIFLNTPQNMRGGNGRR